jgi:hypothetical protein
VTSPVDTVAQPDGFRVAALYGWDLANASRLADPAMLLASGYQLLALDRTAVSTLAAADLPFSTVEDWLGPLGLEPTAARESAARASHGWAEHDRDALTVEGVHWPTLEHQLQPFLWSGLTVGSLLAEAFRTAGVDQLRFLHGYPVHLDALPEAPPDAVARMWMRLLSDVARPVRIPHGPLRTRLRPLLSRTLLGWPLRSARAGAAATRFRVASAALPNPPAGGRIVLTLAGRELLRSAPIVRLIEEHGGAAVVAIPWMTARELTREAAQLTSAPALPTPRLERGGRSDERRLRDGVLRNLALHDLGPLEPVREEITAALVTLSATWAMQVRRLRWTRRALRSLGAGLVVATRLDVSYEVPVEAARSLDLPVLTLPHGIQEWAPPERLAPRPGVAHVAGIVNPTAPPESLRVSPDALIQYEYPHRVRRPAIDPETDRLTVLAVSDGFGSANIPSTGARAHGLALMALARLARERSDVLRVMFKPHPGTPDDEVLLLGAESDTPLEFVSREADLIALLGMADLVIGVNSRGTSLVHAVRATLPTIRLMTDGTGSASGWLWDEPRGWSEFWDDAVVTLTGADMLDPTIMDLIERPSGLEELRSRSRRAASVLLPATGQERLTVILNELLRAHTAGGDRVPGRHRRERR